LIPLSATHSIHVSVGAQQHLLDTTQQRRVVPFFTKKHHRSMATATDNNNTNEPKKIGGIWGSAYSWRELIYYMFRPGDMIRRAWSGDDHTNPKRILERRYVTFSILAMDIRNIKRQGLFANNNTNEIHQAALEQFDKRELDKYRTAKARVVMQDLLQPQVLELFQVFDSVDQTLNIGIEATTGQDGEAADIDPLHGIDWNQIQSILSEERQHTLNLLEQYRSESETNVQFLEPNKSTQLFQVRDPSTNSPLTFLETKLEALDTLLASHDGKPQVSRNGLDAFGNNVDGIEPHTLVLSRQYQSVNMARSALIRKHLGYSILCLRSSIPNAGRGVFVDGCAELGSVVAFVPGDVWAKEFLLEADPEGEMADHFAVDDDCQISVRFDDFFIDSRKSPVSVLTREGSMNPWALGHMVNHPPSLALPNCQTTMLDFTDSMDMAHYVKYIPNTYAREPSWRVRIHYYEPMTMHSYCIMAMKDIDNAELVYDYRLQNLDDIPDWYTAPTTGDEVMDNRTPHYRLGPQKEESNQQDETSAKSGQSDTSGGANKLGS
jgi:hypothetical protein